MIYAFKESENNLQYQIVQEIFCLPFRQCIPWHIQNERTLYAGIGKQYILDLWIYIFDNYWIGKYFPRFISETSSFLQGVTECGAGIARAQPKGSLPWGRQGTLPSLVGAGQCTQAFVLRASTFPGPLVWGRGSLCALAPWGALPTQRKTFRKFQSPLSELSLHSPCKYFSGKEMYQCFQLILSLLVKKTDNAKLCCFLIMVQSSLLSIAVFDFWVDIKEVSVRPERCCQRCSTCHAQVWPR